VSKIIVWNRDHPLVVLFVFAIISIFFIRHVGDIRRDPSSEGFMVAGSPDRVFYDRSLEVFGSDNITIVYIRDRDLFNYEKLRAVEEVFYALQDIPNVTRVDGLFDVTNVKGEDGILSTSQPFTFPDQIYGFSTEGGGHSDRLVNSGTGYVASGNFGTSGDLTMAHEINHNIDRTIPGTWGRHVTDGNDAARNDAWGCAATGGDLSWLPMDDEIAETGFDTRRPWRASGGTDVTVVPDNWPELMSYCRAKAETGVNNMECSTFPADMQTFCGQKPFKWTSKYRWANQFPKFFPPSSLAAEGLEVPVPVYYISGELNMDGSGSLDPVRILAGQPSSDIPPGDYFQHHHQRYHHGSQVLFRCHSGAPDGTQAHEPGA